MLLVIRISGDVDINSDIREALFRLKLRRKYAAILINPTSQNMKILNKLRNHVAFGDINKETLYDLLSERGQLIDKKKKINVEEVISQMEKKNLESLNLKPFFRLHPPRKGIESKRHFGIGKGVLGDNKTHINELVRRML